ncbi:MAG: hypothetical protein E7564_07420 [Ruminococcaceae bacterium]|nr:hypothetical protein [Oscillospiraceae bacterium]
MKYFKEFLYSAFSGVISLILVNLFGFYMGVNLTVSYINSAVSFLLGIPGVTALLVLENFIF